MKLAISVTQLIQYVKRKLDGDTMIQGVLLKGEISNFIYHRSGHCYFTLKDDRAKIACVMFAVHASTLKFKVENGMQVLIRGNVSMFEASGQVQLYVESITQDGLGALYQQLEELKQTLMKEGLFDSIHKKPLLSYPKKIAVISAREGAATQDVFTTLKRRWPIAEILFFPCLVQGKDAAKDLSNTLAFADSYGADVILLVRGGGSIEDLWSFNEELVVRSVFACRTTIVSGVGHETDTTLVDFVSDFRAPTPTAAAELVTPNIEDVRATIQEFQLRFVQKLTQQLQKKRLQFNLISAHPFLKNPRFVWQQKEQNFRQLEMKLFDYLGMFETKVYEYEKLKQIFLHSQQGIQKGKSNLDILRWQLHNKMSHYQKQKEQVLLLSIARLEANSPLRAIQKGYVLTYQDNMLQRSMERIEMDKEIVIQFHDGKLIAMPKTKEKL